ncbi:MAG: transglycosylase SLT domain-containing protein [Bdellovibrionota bacterium]
MKQTKNLFFFLLVASAAFGSTYASPDDESNSLHCTKIFPCYKDLQPRIAFWKSIFSTHGDNAVVFHDIDEPGRVYSVLETNAACTSRNESLPIKRERNRIREILLSLSKKDIYEDSLTEEEQTIAKVFRSPKKSDFFEASKNIRCQDGNQHQFKKAVERYQYYQPEVVKILGEYNLPQEIQYLPFVESSYNPLAFSKVGAAGLWQIMPSTARNLGLKLNAYVDERLDPIKSTQAAAKYFRQSFDILQDEIQRQNYVTQASQLGPLVITSYNYGVGGMKSAIRQYGPDYMNILERYKSRSFQTAVKNFYASFLAAMEVAQHSKQYFGNLPPFMPIEGQSFELPRSISIVKFSQHFNYSLDELKQLNPSFSRRVWKGTFALPKDYTLFVPKGVHSLNELKETVLALNRDDIEVKVDQYRVERGDTACKIASSFRVSCRELIVANDLNSKGLIRVGQILMIPDSSTETAPRVVASIKAAPEPAKDNRPTIMDAEKIKPSPAPKEEVEESQTHELPAQPASLKNIPFS